MYFPLNLAFPTLKLRINFHFTFYVWKQMTYNLNQALLTMWFLSCDKLDGNSCYTFLILPNTRKKERKKTGIFFSVKVFWVAPAPAH